MKLYVEMVLEVVGLYVLGSLQSNEKIPCDLKHFGYCANNELENVGHSKDATNDVDNVAVDFRSYSHSTRISQAARTRVRERPS